MGRLRDELLRKRQFLSDIISQMNYHPHLKSEGSLRVSHNKNGYSYYHHLPKNGKEKPKYIYLPKSNPDAIQQLAQQDYDREVYRIATQQLEAIDRLLSKYDEERLEALYATMHPARKIWVKPYIQDVDEWVQQWLNEDYPPGSFEPGLPIIMSNKEERVRSKSEKIIADKYGQLQIPYRYERPLALSDNGKLVRKRPDFTIFHEKRKMIYYHEHFGKMDDPKYVKDNLEKLDLYSRNGIFPGEKLIITYETSEKPFDSTQFDQFLEHYFGEYLLNG